MIPQPISIDNGAGFNPSATQITVDDTSQVSVGDVYLNTLTPSDPEQILVSVIDTGAILTIVRGHNGTTAAGVNDNQVLRFYSESISLAERTQLDMAILVSDETLIDLSRQRDAGATENWARTSRVSAMAQAKLEARLGALPGGYHTAVQEQGDQIVLEICIRQALLLYSQFYTLTLTDAGTAAISTLKADIEALRGAMVQEAALGLAVPNNSAINRRHPHSKWVSENAE